MSEVVEATMEQRVDAIIDRYGANKQFSLAVLQDTQKTYNYLPREALERVAERLDISLGEVYRLATFFAAFSLQPRGDYVIKVCLGTACHVHGGPRILEQLERDLSIKAGQTTADGKFSVEAVRCVGACALAPVMLVNEEVHGKTSGAAASKLIETLSKGPALSPALSKVEGEVEGNGAKGEEG
jgi:NADH:ubiquinone oxidoreductase subunit E